MDHLALQPFREQGVYRIKETLQLIGVMNLFAHQTCRRLHLWYFSELINSRKEAFLTLKKRVHEEVLSRLIEIMKIWAM